MKQDEIQIWMLIAFIIILAASLYKIYIIFNKPPSGASTEIEHEELRNIIITFIERDAVPGISDKALFEALIQQEDFDHARYKSFNLNRYNQLIQQLFYIYKVNSFPELIESIHLHIADNV